VAIYHLSVKTISRGKGRSSVGAAAYRAGEKLENEQDGKTHDYTRRKGIIYTEIMLPENAPKEYFNRSVLWNSVEKAENRKNARTAREVEIALPIELSHREQIELVRRYVKDNFTDKGMCADIAIHAGHHRSNKAENQHDKNTKLDNPHAHILLTTRPIDQDGKWGGKQRKEYILDKDGNKQYDKKKHTYKCKTVKANNWDEKETLKQWRENWSRVVNRELESKNLPERIDHRSLHAQGKMEQTPTIHMGAAAHRMEQRGIKTEKGNQNRKIEAQNAEIIRLDDEIRKAENQKAHILNLKNQVKEIAKKLETYRAAYVEATKQAIARTEYRENPIYRQQAAQIEECVKTINKQTATIDLLKGQISMLGMLQGKQKRDLQTKILELERAKGEQESKLRSMGVTEPSKAETAINEKKALAAHEKAKAQASMENRDTDSQKIANAKAAYLDLAQTIPASQRQDVIAEMGNGRTEENIRGLAAYQAENAARKELDAVLRPQQEQERARLQERTLDKGYTR